MTAKQYSDLKYFIGQLEGIAFVLSGGSDTSQKISQGIVRIKGNLRILADELWEERDNGDSD